MFPATYTRNSNEVAAVATSRKRTMAQRICTVRENYTETQQNLQQLMSKVDSYLQVNLNPLTQQNEYYACLQNLDYIALCLEDISIWCKNCEAQTFEKPPEQDNLRAPILLPTPPSDTSRPPNGVLEPLPASAPPHTPMRPTPVSPPSTVKTVKHSPKKNNEMLIDFSSASSFDIVSEEGLHKPSKLPPHPSVTPLQPQLVSSTQKLDAPTAKKKIDQLEAEVADKVEENDETVVALPGQEVLDTDKLYVCIITNTKSPGEFFVMVNPLNEQRGFVISRLTEAMEEYYSKNQVDVRQCLTNMTYCAVKQNGEWFRCLITNVSPKDQLDVYFVDYGGEESVHVDTVQPLVPRFCDQPPFARACHLYGIEPAGNGDWSEEAYTMLVHLHCTVLLNMRVDDDSSESLGVTLLLPSGDTVNAELVRAGLAVYNSAASQPGRPTSQPVRPASQPVANAAYKDASTISLQRYSPEDTEGGVSGSGSDPWDYNDCPEYTDPLLAVQGFVSRDEAEICKHYRGPPATTCFKGNNCNKRHVLIHPDGWTSDRVEVISVKLPRELALPAEGSRVTVFVSHVENYKSFFVQFPDHAENITNPIPAALPKLVSRMNAPSVQQSLQPLSGLPAEGEMVAAWFPDKKIYRAQVTDVDGEHNRVQVHYVDFGNRCWTTLNQVYQLSSEFLHTPFLATRCFLADIALKEQSALREAIAVMKDTIVEKPFKANVISIHSAKTLLLELEDSDGFSIVQTLVTQHPKLFSYQHSSRKRGSTPAPKGPIVVPG